MSWSSRFISWLLIVALIISPIGCAGRVSPTLPQSKAQALEQEIARVNAVAEDEKQRGDIVDCQLRLASMALDADRPDLARQTLIEATENMAGLVADKEFARSEKKALATLGGKEQEKYFLGDPYEQMMAYLYLGILDFQTGEYELARSSFRSATVADEGSKQEGYRSDCYLALLLEGITSKTLGEMGQAEEAFRLAESAYAFRQRMPVFSQALYGGVGRLRPEKASKNELKRLDEMFPLAFSHLPAAVAAYDSPEVIFESVFSSAAAELDDPEEDTQGRRFLKACDGKKDEALALLARFEEAVSKSVSNAALEAATASVDDFKRLVEQCSLPEMNTFIIHQIGQAPAKIRRGKYGEEIQFRSYPCRAQRVLCTVSSEGAHAPTWATLAMPGESIDYQARTRGGREMDHILKGRAQFRDAMNVTSMLASGVASAAVVAACVAATTMVTTTVTTVTYTMSSTGAVTATTTTTTSTAPAGMAAAGPAVAVAVGALAIYKLAKVLADHAHPEGDIRGWHELPNTLLLTCGSLEPGKYVAEMHGFDRLARHLDTRACSVHFEVPSSEPALVLCGSPWK